MRSTKIGFFIATVFATSLNMAFAQSAIPDGAPPLTPLAPPAPNGAAPLPPTGLLPSTTLGSDKTGDDRASTRTVKAVPCSTAASETDGFATCIGIPDKIRRSGKIR
jgi:hypothetical protein